MQVSREQKTFSEFFSEFLKSSLNFGHFQKKKVSFIADVFRKNGPRKTWLDQCLKSPVSKDPSESNIINGPKLC